MGDTVAETEAEEEFESLVAIFGVERCRRLHRADLYLHSSFENMIEKTNEAKTATLDNNLWEVWPPVDGLVVGKGPLLRLYIPNDYPSEAAILDTEGLLSSCPGEVCIPELINELQATCVESAKQNVVCVFELAQQIVSKLSVSPSEVNGGPMTDYDREEMFGMGPYTSYDHNIHQFDESFATAPYEILDNIFRWLRFPHELVAASMVSKNWRAVAGADSRFKKRIDTFVTRSIGYRGYGPRAHNVNFFRYQLALRTSPRLIQVTVFRYITLCGGRRLDARKFAVHARSCSTCQRRLPNPTFNWVTVELSSARRGFYFQDFVRNHGGSYGSTSDSITCLQNSFVVWTSELLAPACTSGSHGDARRRYLLSESGVVFFSGDDDVFCEYKQDRHGPIRWRELPTSSKLL